MEISKIKIDGLFVQTPSQAIFYEKSVGIDYQEEMSIFLDDLLYREPMKQYLENLGYEIPKLMIESRLPQENHNSDLETQFSLPMTHDIYEETSFQDFQRILLKLSQKKSDDHGDLIYFKLDFKAIWKGLKNQ